LWKGNRLPKEYPRPIGPWLVAVGVYVCVAGLVALLAFTLERSLSRSRAKPRKERPRVAKALAELKASRRRPSSEFETFVSDYVQDARVLICPTVEKQHMSAGYWPARETPRVASGSDGKDVMSATLDGPPVSRGDSALPARGESGAPSSPVRSNIRRGEEDMAYCYVSGLTQRDPYDWAIAFDEEWSHAREGVNVLHIGGHVGWVTDAEEPIRMLARQTRALGARRRKLTLVRPWWSRNPEPPPFVAPPPPDRSEGKKRTPVGRIILGSACLAAGALLLARVARGMRSPPRKGRPAADDVERAKLGGKEGAGRAVRRLRKRGGPGNAR